MWSHIVIKNGAISPLERSKRRIMQICIAIVLAYISVSSDKLERNVYKVILMVFVCYSSQKVCPPLKLTYSKINIENELVHL